MSGPHTSSEELHFSLLGNYFYMVDCIVFGVSKEVMQSYHCIQFTNSIIDNYKKLDVFIGPDTCKKSVPCKDVLTISLLIAAQAAQC